MGLRPCFLFLLLTSLRPTAAGPSAVRMALASRPHLVAALLATLGLLATFAPETEAAALADIAALVQQYEDQVSPGSRVSC